MPCAVASCDATRRFPFAMLRALVPPRPAQRPAPAANARADARQLNDDNRLERCWKYVQKCDDAISGSGGHDRTHHVACECYRFGLSDADAMEVLRRFNATKTGGEPWTEKELVHKLDSARRKVEADGKFGCRLTETRPGHGGNGLAKWDHLRAEAQQGAAEAKSVDLFGGPPIPLEPPAPPELEPGIFPPVVDDQIFAVADATETPPVLPATIGLVMLATACQGRFCVSPEYDYFEELAFWAAAGLEPGTRKTPALQRMAHWLYAWQKRKREEFQPLIDRATEHAIVTSRIKQLREKAAKAKDATEYGLLKQQALDAEKELPDVPVLPQAIVEDITSEHLATVLGQQGERLSVVSDEGGPLDNITGRYSDGITNADVYLKAYSGSAGSIDRGSRPSIFLRRPTLSMGLSPQPAVISAMVNNPSLRRRGFVARFWLFLPRSNLGYRTGQRHPVPETTAAAYAARLTELMDLPPEPDGNGGHRPRVLKLTGAAWRLWCDFAAEVEEMMRRDGELEDLRDWGGKLPGACVRVAGLFHCVERGADAIRETEGAASGKLTAHHFTRMLTEYDARFTGIPRGSKFVRSGAFNAACERRDVRLVRGTWNEAFIEELANFPAARHDDQVDAAVGAYEALSGAVEPWGAKELKAVFGPSAWEAKAAKSPHDLLMEQLGRH